MSAPVVVQVNPDVSETDVILGAPIVITFDQAIDTTTLTNDTFSVTLPSQTQVITSEELISRGNPVTEPSPQPVTGTFTFATDTQGRTVATFTPDKPFRPNTQYTALLMGAAAELATEDVHNPAGEAMATSYEWTFVQDLVSPSCPNQTPSRAGADETARDGWLPSMRRVKPG